MDSLDAALREMIEDACRQAVTDALQTVDLPAVSGDAEPGSWRSRLYEVHPDTRLGLADVAEALDVSERTVRRYIGGEGGHPPLPSRKGPSGLTVRAGDLVTWIGDVEGGNREW